MTSSTEALRATDEPVAVRYWKAWGALSNFEDDLYERLGGDAVDPFSHIGNDHYDESIEIYDLKDGVVLTDDDRAFIHAAGFKIIYHDRKGDAELAVKVRREKLATARREGMEAALEAVIGSNADLNKSPRSAYQTCIAAVRKTIRAQMEKPDAR